MRRSLLIILSAALVLAGCAFATDNQTTETAETTQVETTEEETTVTTTQIDGLKVTYLNVGKADAIIIQTDESTVMIDTGTADTSTQVVLALKELGVTAIDYLIITHFDQDHVGGAAAVLTNFTVGQVYTTYQSKDSDEIDAYLEALETTQVSSTVLSEVLTFTLDGATYTIYPPEQTEYENDTSNNSSLVIYLTYGERSFFFAGDAEKLRIKEIKDYDVDCDVLKVPHHGGIEDNSAKLIKTTTPTYAIITSSEDEPEDEELVALLEQAGVTVYLTREGTVTVTTDGTDLVVTQE
ncbi:MAG: MBL fold metallo-hydrolase [Lachnospiraceae bacterium]|nr:MBL fold metallo-hydrolase [Lachnospiraceae bacterium]